MRRRLFVMVNRAANAAIRRLKLKRFRGADLLMLTTVGRKTGQERTTPLLYLRDGADWLVVASNGGADWEPGWWLNLRAGSAGEVEVGDETTAVTGTEITGEEREHVYRKLCREVFDYETYQVKVSRQLAVVRLSPAA